MESLSSIGRDRQRQRDDCTPGTCSPLSPSSRSSSKALWGVCGQVSVSSMVLAKSLLSPVSVLVRSQILIFRVKRYCALFCIKDVTVLWWNRNHIVYFEILHYYIIAGKWWSFLSRIFSGAQLCLCKIILSPFLDPMFDSKYLVLSISPTGTRKQFFFQTSNSKALPVDFQVSRLQIHIEPPT